MNIIFTRYEPTFNFECSVVWWDTCWQWLDEKTMRFQRNWQKQWCHCAKALSKPSPRTTVHQWHVQIWANQNEQLTRQWMEPEEGCLYYVAEFADPNDFC